MTDWGQIFMAKGIEGIQAATAKEVTSKKTYLSARNNDSIIVYIPQDIVDNIHTYQTVSTFRKKGEPGAINTALSFHAEGRDERDVYHEAHQAMLADFNARKEAGDFKGDREAEKKAYKVANELAPKPIFVFGVLLLETFKQGVQELDKTTFPAGEPLLLDTNKGKDNGNINALLSKLQDETFMKKAATRPIRISPTKANLYEFEVLDEEDISEDALAILKAFRKEKATVPEETFQNCIFESKLEKQVKEVQSLGFDTSRLEGLEGAEQSEEGSVEAASIDF